MPFHHVFYEPISDHCSNHEETSQLNGFANQLTGFYMMATLAENTFRKYC